MKTTISKLITLGLFCILFLACDRPKCETNNTIFLNNEVRSASYQNELAKQIQSIGLEHLRFWLSDYFENNSKDYFIFYTQGKNLCAQTIISVDSKNQNFADVLKTKGKGRFNAEFKGLSFDIISNDSGDFEFHYTGHESIID